MDIHLTICHEIPDVGTQNSEESDDFGLHRVLCFVFQISMNARNQIQCHVWAGDASTRRAHTDVNARLELKSWVLESIVKVCWYFRDYLWYTSHVLTN